jgi:hypothetical protein
MLAGARVVVRLTVVSTAESSKRTASPMLPGCR